MSAVRVRCSSGSGQLSQLLQQTGLCRFVRTGRAPPPATAYSAATRCTTSHDAAPRRGKPSRAFESWQAEPGFTLQERKVPLLHLTLSELEAVIERFRGVMVRACCNMLLRCVATCRTAVQHVALQVVLRCNMVTVQHVATCCAALQRGEGAFRIGLCLLGIDVIAPRASMSLRLAGIDVICHFGIDAPCLPPGPSRAPPRPAGPIARSLIGSNAHCCH